MPYWAHSEVDGHKHGLLDHLQESAELASSFAENFHSGRLAYWAGLWHDIGKFSPDFQKFINNPNSHHGPDHKFAGAVWANNQLDKQAILLSLIIAGHHGGLADPSGFKARLQEKEGDPHISEAIKAAKDAGVVLDPSESFQDILPPRSSSSILATEVWLRFLFSCLVDADFLDTEAHFSPDKRDRRGAGTSLDELWKLLESNQAPLLTDCSSCLNSLRNEIYRSCLEAATEPPGFFSLTVPTGGGKTRSGIGFALKHVLEHGLKRAIVVLPYTSIIEQTADVYREIFGKDNILEHHSAVVYEGDDESGYGLKMRLASENWDAPIIVTTTVQFFESLFANRPSHSRKLHNIAKSVVILDEVQALPEKFLVSIRDMLTHLVERFGCSVVLSSATQPSLGKEGSVGSIRSVREIIPNPGRYFSLLKRVAYELPAKEESWPWKRVAEEMGTSSQALAVLNTKKDALALLEALDDHDALHISTNMCGAHRREVLAEVRLRLKEGNPCYLVSTQVVEAGVDLDFPLVLRALGPLDRIVQAAGRCNREGRLEKGRVVVFRPEGGGCPPGAYKTGMNTAESILRDAGVEDLHNPSFYERYFSSLHSFVNLDPENIQEMRKLLDFPGVAEKFKLIGDDTGGVIVRYEHGRHGDKVAELLDELKNGNARFALRGLQPYMVNIFRPKLPSYLKEGLVFETLPGIYVWHGTYDPVKGIVDKNIEPQGLVW